MLPFEGERNIKQLLTQKRLRVTFPLWAASPEWGARDSTFEEAMLTQKVRMNECRVGIGVEEEAERRAYAKPLCMFRELNAASLAEWGCACKRRARRGQVMGSFVGDPEKVFGNSFI